MEKRKLTSKEAGRREEFLALRARHNLTYQGIVDCLPPGGVSLKAVKSWGQGSRAVHPLALAVLKHVLGEGDLPRRDKNEG